MLTLAGTSASLIWSACSFVLGYISSIVVCLLFGKKSRRDS